MSDVKPTLSPWTLAAGLAAATLVGALLVGGGSEGMRLERDALAAERVAIQVANAAATVAASSASAETALSEAVPATAEPVAESASEPATEPSAAATTDPAARVGEALTRWLAIQRGVDAVRVVRDRDLVFSSAAEDLAQGPTPRRLVRDEKPLYDLAQRLKAAVEENRAGGDAKPREEIEIERGDGTALRVATAFEAADGTSGAVQVTVDPVTLLPSSHRASGWPLALGLTLLAGGLGYALARTFAGHRGRFLAVAIVALAAILGWLLATAKGSAIDAGTRLDAAVGALAVGQAESVNATLGALGLPATATATGLDTDRLRRPRAVDTAAAGTAEQVTRRMRRVAVTTGSLSLLVLLAFALDWVGAFLRAAHKYRVAYAYTVPAMAGMLLLVFFPFLYGLTLSFTSANIYNSDQGVVDNWIGVENFTTILTDFSLATRDDAGALVWNYRNFYWTLGFTVIWTITNVTIGVTVGLALALALNTPGLRGKAIYRVLLILPWAVPNYITALIWKGMFHQQFGVINQMLQVVGLDAVSWFEKPLTSFATVLATNGWLSFPFMMVISLGALQSIPADLYEAARVDGATKWQQFRFITLPSLKPALVPAIILSVIWTFNMFNIIYLVSQGEPAGSTEILITQAYKLAFEQYRYGYAAAYSTVIFVILLAYGWWQNRVTRASEGA